MLTKEQYQCVINTPAMALIWAVEIAEYESANPPKPVAVPCSACGAPPKHYATSGEWECQNEICKTCGPRSDPDAAKWNKLHGRRKLPLEVWQAYFVFQGKARKMGMPPSGIVFGDPIDISEFLE